MAAAWPGGLGPGVVSAGSPRGRWTTFGSTPRAPVGVTVAELALFFAIAVAASAMVALFTGRARAPRRPSVRVNG